MFVRLLCSIVLLLVLQLALPSRPSSAQELDEQGAIERFFTAKELSPDWFAANLLAAVPFEKIPELREQLAAPLGALEEVRRDGDRWLAVFEKGSIPTLAEVDAQGRFVGLRLLPPVARIGHYDELVARIEALPGEGTILVTVDGKDELALRAEEPFAVGSAFKFVVLRALTREIRAGRMAWDQVVELRPEFRTLPTGTVNSWPDGSPLTLHTLAAFMISQSDNTATDALIHLLGREAVEAADPSERNRPFLTTLEAFKLKDPQNSAWLERWRAGNETDRRSILAELESLPVPPVSMFAGGPLATDVEWFFTARELCALAAEVQALDLMTINPGVISASHFDRVAFKGGSEPGVLNLTTWVRTEDDREACVCASVNGEQEIETTELGGIVGAAFELVRADSGGKR